LGGNQVGKAAIAGWKEIVRPARAQGARIWPFDGELGELAHAGGLTISETYPAEAYAHVGVRFNRARESKTRQHDRAQKALAIETWAERQQVHFDPLTQAAIRDGFGPELVGEDRFDALLGLLGMIEVVDGRREEAPQSDSCLRTWEGWILGQASQTVALQAAG
jgi:hypothetical protein